MKPIKATINNFQSIKELEFEINGFTCITGKTNIGKSAIIRALKSSLLNTPVTNMVRNGSKFCGVELHSEEWGFKWQKGAGTNRYYIDGKDEPLDSVGRGQIEEITNFGFGSIKVGDSKKLHPWFASQFKPIFLLDQSGPAITDFISDVSRLDVLQRGIGIANKGKRRAKDRTKLIEEDLKSQKAQRNKFDRHEEMKAVLLDLREQKLSIEEYNRKIDRGTALDSSIRKCQNDVALFANIERVKIPSPIGDEDVRRLLVVKKFNDQLQEKAQAVISVKGIGSVSIPEKIDIPEIEKMAKIYSFQQKKREYELAIEKLSQDIKIPELPESPEKLEKGSTFMARMNALVQEINKLETSSQNLKMDLTRLNDEIAKIPKCSTCEQPWDSSHAHA